MLNFDSSKENETIGAVSTDKKSNKNKESEIGQICDKDKESFEIKNWRYHLTNEHF